MIAVIADDFTGAAEIGGIGLRYGLRVAIETTVPEHEDADLLVIVDNTRSMPPDLAEEMTEEITGELIGLGPDFIFKKLDSVLRGNVAHEIRAQLKAEGKKKAILIPGNPGLGRIIEKGQYFVNGIPIHKTFFANTPDFPVDSSRVEEIIGRDGIRILSRSLEDRLPDSGIIVGDVTTLEDLQEWGSKIGPEILSAGGAGFFNVILSGILGGKKDLKVEKFQLEGRSLFILGSRYPKDEKMNSKIQGNGLQHMNMPVEIYKNRNFDPGLLELWTDRVSGMLEHDHKVVITLNHKSHDEPGLSVRLRLNLGALVRQVIKKIPLDNLLIEGGATTFDIIKALDIRKLYPVRELATGIIQMRADEYPGMCITTKPGSYQWPDNVEFQSRESISLRKGE